MYSSYKNDVEFLFVYCREAHAIDSAWPVGKEIEQPVSLDERRTVAADFLEETKLEIPSLLDTIDNKTANDYSSLPDRLYLVGKDGKIAYAGGHGPFGFKPGELEDAIKKELAGKSTAGGNDSAQGDSRNDRRIRRMMSLPLYKAINTDGDAKLSESEIRNAAAALKKLDKDGDGELSREELTPTPPSRRER